MNHTERETQIKGSNSWWNQEEIRQILNVAEYLMKNDYDADDVTVLCPYRGQVYLFDQIAGERLCNLAYIPVVLLRVYHAIVKFPIQILLTDS